MNYQKAIIKFLSNILEFVTFQNCMIPKVPYRDKFTTGKIGWFYQTHRWRWQCWIVIYVPFKTTPHLSDCRLYGVCWRLCGSMVPHNQHICYKPKCRNSVYYLPIESCDDIDIEVIGYTDIEFYKVLTMTTMYFLAGQRVARHVDL